MNRIKIIDARMGRGKTTAAINYMEANRETKRFLYVTPYLSEVDRICNSCDFEQPEDDDQPSKMADLKGMMKRGENVSATHSLFYQMDEEALELARSMHYTLIVDESINVVERINVSDKDLTYMLDEMVTEDEDGFLHWIDPEYKGMFSRYKKYADAGTLYHNKSILMSVMHPSTLRAFDEVIMMTYLFMGQYQRAYLDFFGFEYDICGVSDEGGSHFTDCPDNPPPVDFGRLINIIDDPRLNLIGRNPNDLSKAWYERRGRNNPQVKQLRNNMNTFFRRRVGSKSSEQLWTCFKSHAHKLCGDRNRGSSSFLQLGARATNEYRSRHAVAYMVNRFLDPTIKMFFDSRDKHIDPDAFALSEMLQWIWRSCIRDGKPIDLYIPSARMRRLLLDWIDTTSKGVDYQ